MNENIKTNTNKTLLLAITMTASFFNPLMGAAVNIALKKIGHDFSLNAIELSWISMAFLLSSAVFLVPSGKLGDIWGRKKLFLAGNVVFSISSIFCGIADSGTMLIISRFFQGIGGAMSLSVSMAIVISAFKPQERGKVIGLNVSAVYVGLSAAPILGGLLTEGLGWRSLFFINAIVTLLILIIVIYKIKEEWRESEQDKFDWIGTLIYMPSLSSLMYGLSKLPTLPAILFTIAGIIGLIIFVLFEYRNEYPVLNMKLFFNNKVFASSNLSALINYAATFAVGFVLSLYLQYAKHLTPKEAGMVLMTQPILMAILAIISGRLSDKVNPRWLASTGMALSVIGVLMLSFISKDTDLQYIVYSLAVLGVGFGLFSSPNTNVIMSSVDKRFYGIANATVSTMRTTGMMFSMAIATLSIHLFIGTQIISDSNIHLFIQGSKLIFILFTILCIIGVFSSLVGKNKTDSNQ